jgi:hypothetical protein
VRRSSQQRLFQPGCCCQHATRRPCLLRDAARAHAQAKSLRGTCHVHASAPCAPHCACARAQHQAAADRHPCTWQLACARTRAARTRPPACSAGRDTQWRPCVHPPTPPCAPPPQKKGRPARRAPAQQRRGGVREGQDLPAHERQGARAPPRGQRRGRDCRRVDRGGGGGWQGAACEQPAPATRSVAAFPARHLAPRAIMACMPSYDARPTRTHTRAVHPGIADTTWYLKSKPASDDYWFAWVIHRVRGVAPWVRVGQPAASGAIPLIYVRRPGGRGGGGAPPRGGRPNSPRPPPNPPPPPRRAWMCAHAVHAADACSDSRCIVHTQQHTHSINATHTQH